MPHDEPVRFAQRPVGAITVATGSLGSETGSVLSQVTDERAASQVLSLVWVVAAAEGHEAALRVAEPESGALVLTRAEGRQVEAAARGAAEAARGAAEAARESESRARKAAEARIVELEAELGRRGGG
jgi:hypothetical protein